MSGGAAGTTDPLDLDELVAANHVLAMLGLVDAFGHIAMRDPADPERYFLSRGMAATLVTRADIQHFDLDSNPIDPAATGASIERFIYSGIFRARPDVNAIVHTHSPNVIPFSVSSTPLRPISHAGAFLSPQVPVYDARDTVGASNFMISTPELGSALAAALGTHSAALIRGHGNVVVGANPGMAVYRAHHMDKTAQLLLGALQLGGTVTYVHPDEAALAVSLRDTGYVRQWELWKREALIRRHAERQALQAAGL